jgi:hypothetical protein
VIQKAPAKAGLGLDSWRPRDWEHLPKPLLEEPTSILEEKGTGLRWPSQVLQVLLAFIPKPVRIEYSQLLLNPTFQKTKNNQKHKFQNQHY